MAVNCIRQRKKWTATLSTMDGVAAWPNGAGTPDEAFTFPQGVFAVSGNTAFATDTAAFVFEVTNFQNPRYNRVRCRFQITGSGPSLSPQWSCDLVYGPLSADDQGTTFSFDTTLQLTITPTARPVDSMWIQFQFGGTYEEGDPAASVVGTITFEFFNA